jgi:hypothetical protein
MSTTDHADLEALSAYVDGEAPEWADHVAGCEECRAAAARIGAVAAALRAPVDPPAAAVRERAVTAALDEARHESHRARFERRRAPRPWALPAVAAAVVGLLGLSGLVLSADRSPDESPTFAGPALQDAKTESGVAGAAPSAPPADLGDITDPLVLRMRAGFPTASLARTDSGDVPPPSSATNTGNTGAAIPGPPSATSGSSGAAAGSAGGTASIAPPTTTLSQRSAAPNAVGTRPCEEQARAREPSLGPVTYFATARRGDVPAYVLAFGDFSRFTLLLLAQNGCGELLRSVGP